MESKNINELLDAIAKVLLRCAILGLLLVTLWFGLYVFAWPALYSLHGSLFGLTQHELDLIHYCGMAWVKACTFLFFLFPYVAIRWVLRSSA